MSQPSLSILTLREIRRIARQNQFSFPHFTSVPKETVLSYIRQNASVEVMHALYNEAMEKAKRSISQNRSTEHSAEHTESRKQRRRIKEYQSVKARSEYQCKEYLAIPSAEEIKDCYTSFYDATSDNAVKLVVCGVCGREVGVVVDDVKVIDILDLPNRH